MAKKGVRFQYEEWARQRAVTTEEKYRLGHTDTYLPVRVYYAEIVPLFIDQTPDESGHPPVEETLFMRLAEGGILDSNHSMGMDISRLKRIYVKDSAKTRSRLKEMASLSTRIDRRIWAATHIVTIGCAEAWGIIVLRIQKIQQRLSMVGWETMFVNNRLDLAPLLKIGAMLDSGQIPLGLLRVTVRLATVRLLDFLKNHHPSGGMLQGKPLKLMYRTTVSITHTNGYRREVIYVTPALRVGLPYLSVERQSRQRKQKLR